tara:strand:- start:92 stop:913 length:822 start_codon:yes stop_codon:yes gene_type:complete
MGNCTYCGRPAGLLKKKHRECDEKFVGGRDYVVSLIESLEGEATDIEAEIDRISEESFIQGDIKREVLAAGYDRAVNRALEDDLLSEEEERILGNIQEHFGLSQDELNKKGSYTRLVQGAILRELINGKIPERIEVQGSLPFNLLKTEKIIWVFQDVRYYEQKKSVSYVGGSSGVSVRVAKGVYLRTSAFKGRRIESYDTVSMGFGILGVTNKHLYFSGDQKTFRIRLDKIVAIDPHSDGVTIHRDAQSAKPQSFATGDGWFMYNLLTNASQL